MRKGAASIALLAALALGSPAYANPLNLTNSVARADLEVLADSSRTPASESREAFIEEIMERAEGWDAWAYMPDKDLWVNVRGQNGSAGNDGHGKALDMDILKMLASENSNLELYFAHPRRQYILRGPAQKFRQV